MSNRLEKYQVKDWLNESIHWGYIDRILDDSFLDKGDIEQRIRKDTPIEYVWPMIAFVREVLPADCYTPKGARVVVLYGLGCVAFDMLKLKYPDADLSYSLREVLEFLQDIVAYRYPNHLIYIRKQCIPKELRHV
jgi:hypothetical protein